MRIGRCSSSGQRETTSYVGLVATAIISSDNNDNLLLWVWLCSVTKVGRTDDRVTATAQRTILLLCTRITKTRRRRRDGRTIVNMKREKVFVWGRLGKPRGKQAILRRLRRPLLLNCSDGDAGGIDNSDDVVRGTSIGWVCGVVGWTLSAGGG